MEQLEIYSVKSLSFDDKISINGGTEPAEGSYGIGYAIGSFIGDVLEAEITYAARAIHWLATH